MMSYPLSTSSEANFDSFGKQVNICQARFSLWKLGTRERGKDKNLYVFVCLLKGFDGEYENYSTERDVQLFWCCRFGIIVSLHIQTGNKRRRRRWWEKENSLKKMGDRLGSRAPMWLLLGFGTEI